ncbi:MAG: ABC transporter permease subunit SaoP [Syntrophomonadaceae bacterium]|jgi:NitT/TauT family transport system permease protein
MARNGSAVPDYKTAKLTLGDIFDKYRGNFYTLAIMIILIIIWHFAANRIQNTLLLPYFLETAREFLGAWTDPVIMSNLALTLRRVFTGFVYAFIIGIPLGLLMGYSTTAMQAISPVMNSVRQVPIMAWVPLSIIWFGLGDGPTVFLIAMSAVFPLALNTIAGVYGIDPNYYNAARSMGASLPHIIKDIVIPGALPSILTGCRLAMGAGWMSVICAEFIATSAGFGFLMVEAQVRLETAQLYALMVMSGLVGFIIDRGFLIVEQKLTSWRFKDGFAGS